MPAWLTIWCGDVGGTRVTLLGATREAQRGVVVLEWLARYLDADMCVRAAWVAQNGQVLLSPVLDESTAVAPPMASIPRLKAIREALAIALRLPS
jgi:hypothetical protein